MPVHIFTCTHINIISIEVHKKIKTVYFQQVTSFQIVCLYIFLHVPISISYQLLKKLLNIPSSYWRNPFWNVKGVLKHWRVEKTGWNGVFTRIKWCRRIYDVRCMCDAKAFVMVFLNSCMYIHFSLPLRMDWNKIILQKKNGSSSNEIMPNML